VALDTAGNLYIGSIPTVRVVTPGGVIGPGAGSGLYGFSGDGGPATAAALTVVSGLAVDSASNVYISDSGNRRVRQVQPAVSPSIALSPTYVTFSLAATGSTATTQTLVLSNSGQGTLNWASSVATTAGGAWLSVAPSTGSILAGQAGTTVTVTANPSGLSIGDYYGQIEITSPNAASPVQMVTARLTIQTPGGDPPLVAAGGVLNAASFSLSTPVAPGTVVSIFGSNLTDSAELAAAGFPLPTQLGGTSVTIGGEAVPLLVVTAGQINAMVPFDLAVNTSVPIVVTRNNALSAPQPVSVVSSQPGVFTQSETGQGIGIVVIVHADGSQVEAGNGNSATAGDAVVIYCAGLGDTAPRTVAGFPATASPLEYVIDPVTVTIGGVNAPVFFAGLSPGFAGLYQVNATVPAGITPNPQAPLVLSQGGRKSAAVTLPVQ
jgi:adhesin/invasin